MDITQVEVAAVAEAITAPTTSPVAVITAPTTNPAGISVPFIILKKALVLPVLNVFLTVLPGNQASEIQAQDCGGTVIVIITMNSMNITIVTFAGTPFFGPHIIPTGHVITTEDSAV